MINDESSLDEIIEHIGIVIPPDRTYEPYYKVNNKKKESDKAKDLGEELADVAFVVLCLANQTGIDLQVAFDKKMDLKSVRDKDRHKNNEKLK